MSQPSCICPVCQTAYQPQDTACDTCGLIFATYAGAAIGATIPHPPPASAPATTACPHCGQPTRPDAKACVHCGASLVYQYRQLQPGQSLANGRYTVQRALSKGGMGAIYLATDHEAFDRTVVIKAMLDYFDPQNQDEVQAAQKRFLQEAKTLSTLRHPSIPQIYTYFQDGPHNYIVMEHIEGHDLEQQLTRTDDATGQRIPGRPYPDEDVIRWGVALCRVLEYLAGLRPDPVVHHDIKPANVLLDRNSNEIRLVDFGTAKARLLVQQSGSVGVQKSSVFGTQGYAPPEQYHEQSEPRSDVYALAATLYHLATDDDPGVHPFDFPKVNHLGRLGPVLEQALQPNVNQRPTAAELRQQLEAIIAPGANPIQAPNGTDLHNEQELAKWCEQHWTMATDWLYRNLPDQVENIWGRNKLAQDVRSVVIQQSSDRNAGLDAALALFDPQGFGSEKPRLKADKGTLNFGSLPVGGKSAPLSFTLRNEGRRYVAVRLEQPKWVTGGQSQVTLVPGQSETMTLTADMDRVSVGGTLSDKVTARAGTDTLATVHVQSNVSRWKTLWKSIWRDRWPFWVCGIIGSVWALLNASILYLLQDSEDLIYLFMVILPFAYVFIFVALKITKKGNNIVLLTWISLYALIFGTLFPYFVANPDMQRFFSYLPSIWLVISVIFLISDFNEGQYAGCLGWGCFFVIAYIVFGVIGVIIGSLLDVILFEVLGSSFSFMGVLLVSIVGGALGGFIGKTIKVVLHGE